MKNLIKIILIVGFVGLFIFGVVSCTSNMDIDFSGLGELFEGWGTGSDSGSNSNDVDYSEYRKDYNQDSPKGKSGIYDKTYVMKDGEKIWYNVFGLPFADYGNGNVEYTVGWDGGNNGKGYKNNMFDIVTPIYTENYLEDSLKEAKEAIASENMSVNYQYLFDNKTYTNSNATHKLSLETAVGETSFVQFESKMFKEFDKAIARKENFLIYCSERSINDGYYGKPFAYGYVEGLGYIIISVSRYGCITISVENKYFTRIDIDNNIMSWYSNEDAVKIPVAKSGRIYKGVFWDYSPNMIRATALGLFNKNKESYYYSDNFIFTEGEFTGFISDYETIHLYGANPYNIKDSAVLAANNYLGGYLTDFNNFFYGNNTYALFGELADISLKTIVNTIFSVKMQPCNDFEEECNWKNEDAIKTNSNHSDELKEMYADAEKGTMTNLRRISNYFDFKSIHEIDYTYPTREFQYNDACYIDGKYYYFPNGCDFDYCMIGGEILSDGASKIYEWWSSFDTKPYIKAYFNNEGYVTARNFSFCLGEEINFVNHNAEIINKFVGLTTEAYDKFNSCDYSDEILDTCKAGEEYYYYLKEEYGYISNDGYLITDENNVFRLRFEN